jgi:hypothetical protein
LIDACLPSCVGQEERWQRVFDLGSDMGMGNTHQIHQGIQSSATKWGFGGLTELAENFLVFTMQLNGTWLYAPEVNNTGLRTYTQGLVPINVWCVARISAEVHLSPRA